MWFCLNATAENNSCTLLNDKGYTTWVMVYQEVGNSQHGQPIGEYKLTPNGTQPITSQNGRIRYDYKNDPNDKYHGDVGAWCHNSETVRVP
jgi:hypothetical protein